MKNFKFEINGKAYSVDIKDADGQEMKLSVNGVDYNVTVDREVRKHSTVVTERTAPHVTAAANVVQRYTPVADIANATVPSPAKTAKAAAAQSVSGSTVTAPLPGTILDIFVNVGDAVKEGQSVLLLEAMKMENHIEADVAGTVTEIRVRKGDSVLEGDILIVIG